MYYDTVNKYITEFHCLPWVLASTWTEVAHSWSSKVLFLATFIIKGQNPAFYLLYISSPSEQGLNYFTISLGFFLKAAISTVCKTSLLLLLLLLIVIAFLVDIKANREIHVIIFFLLGTQSGTLKTCFFKGICNSHSYFQSTASRGFNIIWEFFHVLNSEMSSAQYSANKDRS